MKYILHVSGMAEVEISEERAAELKLRLSGNVSGLIELEPIGAKRKLSINAAHIVAIEERDSAEPLSYGSVRR